MGDAIPIPWDAYTSSVITIELPTGRLVAEPTDDDPEGRLPNGLAEPVHVITAWNPGSRELEADDNDTRNAEMRAELDRRNAPWFPARGAAPDASPEDKKKAEDSANSQFFIVFEPTLKLDFKYTVFGRVVDGMQYVDAIQRGEPPANPSRILHAYIAADNPPPYKAEAPAPAANSALGPAVTLPGAKN